jgi:hypothetical protein
VMMRATAVMTPIMINKIVFVGGGFSALVKVTIATQRVLASEPTRFKVTSNDEAGFG